MLVRRLVVFVALVFIVPSLFAAPRVFVASTGTDTGVCSRSAPCRNFAYAITQASPGGEVVALDTAGYGAVTVTFAVSIYSAPGAVASITAAAGNDITITAGPSDKVMIRGLFLNSSGSNRGISFDSGAALTVQDTTFTGFSADAALDFERGVAGATDSPNLVVSNCRFFNNYQGIYAWSGNATPMRLTMRNSEFSETATQGVYLGDYVRAAVTDSTFSHNAFALEVVTSSAVVAAGPEATVDRCTFLNNGTALDAFAGGQATALIHLANSVVTNNGVGVFASGGGSVQSLTGAGLTNTILLNGSGNSCSTNYAAQ